METLLTQSEAIFTYDPLVARAINGWKPAERGDEEHQSEIKVKTKLDLVGRAVDVGGGQHDLVLGAIASSARLVPGVEADQDGHEQQARREDDGHLHLVVGRGEHVHLDGGRAVEDPAVRRQALTRRRLARVHAGMVGLDGPQVQRQTGVARPCERLTL